jgi:serine decarboxylase
VLDFFAKLWKLPADSYWGYVTTCGTEGNLEAIYLAREKFPEGVLIASRESHYSVFKAAKFYRMSSVSVGTLTSGEIDYDELADVIAEHKDGQIILSLNIGTTVKGAVDSLSRVLRLLHVNNVPRERYYIHCDGALFALMMPFVTHAEEVSFRRPIDSIAVSGHKFLGSPMPCGICLTYKSNVKRVETEIEYLNSVDTTITGSRNGQASLFLWYSLRRKGLRGLWLDVQQCFKFARHLKKSIADAGLPCMLNDLSTTVVFERPTDEKFVRKWQLACVDTIAHAVVMPSSSMEKIDTFVSELIEVTRGTTRRCVAKHIGMEKCLCSRCVH